MKAPLLVPADWFSSGGSFQGAAPWERAKFLTMGDRISEEILETAVFSSLNFNTISRAACVSQRWRRAARTLSARIESASVSGSPPPPQGFQAARKSRFECKLRHCKLRPSSAQSITNPSILRRKICIAHPESQDVSPILRITLPLTASSPQ